MWSTFCIRVSLTRGTVTGASSSNKLRRSSFELLISRRQRRCENPGELPACPCSHQVSLGLRAANGAAASWVSLWLAADELPRAALAPLLCSLCDALPGTGVTHLFSQLERFHFSLPVTNLVC